MPASTPAVIIEPFGLNAASPANLQVPIPVPTQLPGNPGFASFNDGFPSDTFGGGGLPPRGQDMNGILYMITAYLAAYQGGQFSQYNSTWSAANGGYASGAIVLMASEFGFWVNTVANNTNNPDTTAAATSGWVPVAFYGETTSTSGLTGGSVTLTANQAAQPFIYLSGALTSNLSLYFPPWVKQWRIFNGCTGNFSINAYVTGSGAAVLIGNFGATGSGYTDIYGDGTNLHFGGYFGAGTFTCTWNGFSAAPGLNTVYYTVSGTVVMLRFYSVGTGTSNSYLFYMGGMPAFLLNVNVAQTYRIAGLINNGTTLTTGLVGVTNIGLNFYPADNNISWTNSGSKGFDTTFVPSFSYTLL